MMNDILFSILNDFIHNICWLIMICVVTGRYYILYSFAIAKWLSHGFARCIRTAILETTSLSPPHTFSLLYDISVYDKSLCI